MQSEYLSNKTSMKKVFTLLALMFLELAACAQDTVWVSKPGMLQETLEQQGLHNILDLAIIGDIDGKDFFYIKNSKCVQRTLDLSQARIVWGTVPYSNDGGKEQQTKDDEAGDYLFACSWLNTIILPKSTKRIGKYCFSGAHALRKVVVYDNVEEIDSCAFQDSGITDMEIPESVTRLHGGVFALCHNLQHFKWPAHLPIIPPQTFTGSRLQEIELPVGLKEIGDQSLGLTSLTHINIPETVEKIGIQALASFKGDTIIVPNSVREIDIQAFVGTNAKYAILSSQLSVVPTQLFAMSEIEEVYFPEGVKKVENEVFWDCKKMRKLVLPSTLESFDDYMFSVKLDQLWCYAPEPPACNAMMVNPYYNNLSSHCLLYVPQGSLELYQSHPQWGGFFKILEIGTDIDPELQICPDDQHPHAIDLGLPSGTKWSCCNVGSDVPKGCGGYYAWGEILEKDIYTYLTYKYCTITYLDERTYDIQYHDYPSYISGSEYDVAYVKWGDCWKMPSLSQIHELYDECAYQWISFNGFTGGLFTGPSGAKIFIPAAGIRDSATLYDYNKSGNYWSGEPSPKNAYRFEIRASSKDVSREGCCQGLTVRPVYNTSSSITLTETGSSTSSHVIYNVFGIKVADNLDNASTLPPGIYIFNGKKFVIK